MFNATNIQALPFYWLLLLLLLFLIRNFCGGLVYFNFFSLSDCVCVTGGESFWGLKFFARVVGFVCS